MKRAFVTGLLSFLIAHVYCQAPIIEYSHDSLYINGVLISNNTSKALFDSIIGQESKIDIEKVEGASGTPPYNCTTYIYKELGLTISRFSDHPDWIFVGVSLFPDSRKNFDKDNHFFATFNGKIYVEHTLLNKVKTENDLSKLSCPYSPFIVDVGPVQLLLNYDLKCGNSPILLMADRSRNVTSVTIQHNRRDYYDKK